MRHIFTLTPTAPYDFGQLLALIRRYPHPTTDRVSGDSLRRVFRVGGALVLAEMCADGDDLRAEAVASDGAYDPADLAQQVAHWLGIDHQRAGLAAALADHPRLREALQPVIGLPLLRAADLFEPLACAVIEQQISWRGALRAQHWLMDWAGEGVRSVDGAWHAAFPSAARLAAASHDDLLPLKITHKRIDLLRGLAQAAADGSLNLAALDGLAEADRMRALTALKGIGAWTAAVALSRRYGAGAAVPLNDVALQAAANVYFFGREGRLPVEVLASELAPLGVWAGTAAALLLCRWVLERY